MIPEESINMTRRAYYGLFNVLFTFFDEFNEFESVVKTIDILNQNPVDEHSMEALAKMKEFLSKGGYDALKEESNLIFYSPSTALIPITASYYDEQRDDGKKYLEMKNYVLRSKFRLDSENFKEHEDHIGFIFLFMKKLIEESMRGDENSKILSIEVFREVLNGMSNQFSENLYNHPDSDFYKQVAIILKVFIEVERFYMATNMQK